MKIRRMPRRIVAAGWILAVTLMVSGCGAPNDAPDSDYNSTQAESSGAPSAIDQINIDVTVVDAAGLEEVVASHIGNVVLLDAWATW